MKIMVPFFFFPSFLFLPLPSPPLLLCIFLSSLCIGSIFSYANILPLFGNREAEISTKSSRLIPHQCNDGRKKHFHSGNINI